MTECMELISATGAKQNTEQSIKKDITTKIMQAIKNCKFEICVSHNIYDQNILDNIVKELKLNGYDVKVQKSSPESYHDIYVYWK